MNWKSATLEQAPLEIIDGDRGSNYPGQSELLEEGYCLFLSATNVTQDGFRFEKNQFISEQKDHALRKGRLKRDDVVMTTRGTLGNFAWFSKDVQYGVAPLNVENERQALLALSR